MHPAVFSSRQLWWHDPDTQPGGAQGQRKPPQTTGLLVAVLVSSVSYSRLWGSNRSLDCGFHPPLWAYLWILVDEQKPKTSDPPEVFANTLQVGAPPCYLLRVVSFSNFGNVW